MTVGPVIIALDASAQHCSAALLSKGQIRGYKQTQARGHDSLLLGWVEALLAEAELSRSAVDAFAFAQGPGSFTGVRIASGVTQGLAFGLDRPVIGLSSLQLLAEQAAAASPDAEGLIVSLLDARMGEIYGGVFSRMMTGDVRTQPVGQEWLGTPQISDLPTSPWLGVGEGFSAYPELQAESQRIAPGLFDALPDARFGLQVAASRYQSGQLEPAHQAQPIYLRNQVAKKAGGL
ncbi:tRNA (adenosine(37)-N6)-threonylcarbamoyltransferase complex dimerization subunit type 1 TsaB [Spiribacter sp. C176]|uniref:tRNA threonylcarbamoyladenosine biosynthesis protein TsaB n=1 Tax=Spiribacter salilacus TaxID=2664894 RepID=A0A6N7QQY4_9GAMM|nr:tRNA (adenosine(37)-N6)-threonylcarbamoyltransferase complex dimerization subunit type 1 TsaB [Spiribacter salilacus]MRH78816.1 tRNA (adenosine(37)-N6)-threonylcarbamoyltransferase complex dimerization subunit type 1 TsaB [Spiribacter salilacus]